jgi:SAM-dependent methyltransferase
VVNEYTVHWFAAFMDTMPEEWTAMEVEGVRRRLPLPEFRRVLDVCCGTGRHAERLSGRGYEVTGIDRDGEALRRARLRAPRATFLQLDQRNVRAVAGPFDAAVILWQSFGHFDPTTNDRILADIATLLRPGGRLLLDLFHPEPLIAERGAPVRSPRAEGVVITNLVKSGRLESRIQYPDGAPETMSFELFTPAALIERAGRAGFTVIEQCCWWDEARPPDPTVHRYQSVFERRSPVQGPR